jgi:hypothetical protein
MENEEWKKDGEQVEATGLSSEERREWPFQEMGVYRWNNGPAGIRGWMPAMLCIIARLIRVGA